MSVFDETAKRWGPKRKWMAFAAAVTAFLELSDDEQTEFVQRVSMHELAGNYDVLVKQIAMNRSASKLRRPGQEKDKPRKVPRGAIFDSTAEGQETAGGRKGK